MLGSKPCLRGETARAPVSPQTLKLSCRAVDSVEEFPRVATRRIRIVPELPSRDGLLTLEVRRPGSDRVVPASQLRSTFQRTPGAPGRGPFSSMDPEDPWCMTRNQRHLAAGARLAAPPPTFPNPTSAKCPGCSPAIAPQPTPRLPTGWRDNVLPWAIRVGINRGSGRMSIDRGFRHGESADVAPSSDLDPCSRRLRRRNLPGQASRGTGLPRDAFPQRVQVQLRGLPCELEGR